MNKCGLICFDKLKQERGEIDYNPCENCVIEYPQIIEYLQGDEDYD